MNLKLYTDEGAIPKGYVEGYVEAVVACLPKKDGQVCFFSLR